MTWRQHRTTLFILAAVFLGLAAVFVAVTVSAGPVSEHPTNPTGIHELLYRLELVNEVLLPLPALIGMFLGAPLLAAEYEHRTVRYAWTQSVSRWHWLSTKLLLLGSAVVLLATAFSTTHMWWYTTAGAPHEGPFRIFNQGPLSFPAACLFAFVVGVAAGTVLRRTVAAMGLTIAGTWAASIVFVNWLRPNYMTPVTDANGASTSGGWFLSQTAVRPEDFVGVDSGGRINGLIPVTTFQPADRFWTFQVIEAGLYLGLTVACVAVAFWWVRRAVA
ncbi:ABC transporter permease [Allokutzneria sp. A3M-2-11 16]|nr:ABC transporter permease [Allokutzneria sp. A3M-2-11 16]MCP3801051.1 ABC transporter permease [Allokutzneria sp. A3M-2-11 16]